MTDQASGKKVSQPIFCAEPTSRDLAIFKSSLLLDSSMSYTAKGLLLTCLSAGYSFDKKWIASRGTDSLESISAALKELLALGYLRRVSSDGDHLYVFTDSPEPPTVTLPVLPKRRGRALPAARISLEPWLEPHRPLLERWLAQRKKAHPKLAQEVTARSMTALRHANDRGVLAEFCELAAEGTWQSLGFNGYRNYIDKLVADRAPGKPSRPQMSEINYTLK